MSYFYYCRERKWAGQVYIQIFTQNAKELKKVLAKQWGSLAQKALQQPNRLKKLQKQLKRKKGSNHANGKRNVRQR